MKTDNKKRNKKMLILVVIGIVLAGFILIVIAGCLITQNIVYTPPFKDSTGHIVSGSIAEFQRVTLGGNSQAVLIRGRNIDNPVILFLHMGPGLSETGMMRNINSRLEDYYTMVYLDQRGGGKSYSLFNDPADFTTDQLVQDIHELTLYLKKKLNKNNIIIMGHSFGAPFALIASAKYPGDYSMYIGIGQPVNSVDCDRLSYEYTLDIAKKEVNTDAIAQLEKIKDYWNTTNINKYTNSMMILKKWVGYYGGQVYGETGPTSFILNNSMCNEYTLFDLPLVFAPLRAVKSCCHTI